MDEKGRLPLKGKPAGNFLEYVRERMDTFDERPLCAVDSIVFSWLSYAHIGPELTRACTVRGIALHELLRAEDFGGMSRVVAIYCSRCARARGFVPAACAIFDFERIR